jgi:two-component sensor histidine kinase/PAS domain-containing protein
LINTEAAAPAPQDRTRSGMAGQKPRQISTQRYLLALVAAVVIPLLAFAAFLLLWYVNGERARTEREALQIARQVALLVDGELERFAALLQGLAASSSLQSGNLAQFHVEAGRLAEGGNVVIVLREFGPRQLVNTQVDYGTALPPPVPLSEREREQFAAGRTVISGVYKSPISGETRIAVAVPVRIQERADHILAITLETTRIRETILSATPHGWLIGIGDAGGTVVARSERHEEFTGTRTGGDFLRRATGPFGTLTTRSLDGREILAGYVRSPFANWLVASAMDKAEVNAPIWRSLAALASIGAAALILSAVMAYLFGNTFAAASNELARRATLIGEGRPMLPMRSPLAEFSFVGDALETAGSEINERTRELQAVLDTVPAIVGFTYDPQGRQIILNEFAANLLQVRVPDATSFRGRAVALDHVRLIKEDRPIRRDEMPLTRALHGETVEEEEYVCVLPDGTRVVLLTSATALRTKTGAIEGAVSVSIDITERRKAEEQRRLLVNELNHRVKNTLATVQSIAAQTLGSATTPENARQAVTERLIALARAHDLLNAESWEGAELRDIVVAATTPFGAERFEIAGPSVWLPPNFSLALALTLNELATNATKYGALSVPTGRVMASWKVEEVELDRRLTLCWSEHGGPPVHEPQRSGFGSKIIERSVAGEREGLVTVEYARTGLVCVLRVRVPRRTLPPRQSGPAAAKAVS